MTDRSGNAAVQILSVISFSATGAALARHLKECLPGMSVRLYGKYSAEAGAEAGNTPDSGSGGNGAEKEEEAPGTGAENREEETPVTCGIAVWAGERMAEKDALLFIGASGIAVRSIAPHIRNKLVDSPVLVMDELGKHIIPLLSGHVGGANEIAMRIAKAVGADPVITTATDLHDRFAVDVFAKKQHLRIVNKNGIAPVSSKVLRGETLTMAVQEGCISAKALEELPEDITLVPYGDLAAGTAVPAGSDSRAEEHLPVDILVAADDIPGRRTICLAPKPYVIGIGCRRGKDAESVESFLNGILAECGISVREIRAAASIDIKKEEEGILAFCRKYKLPYLVFSAEELLAAPGEYEESAFVKETVGVGNVCERAAALAAAEAAAETEEGAGEPEFVCRKRRGDGVTCAVARWR
ncbi:MAG: cobalamin biosynthesis protein [Lachnospiraceae bacterium]|nr:cobalamin biosynthesis protein [Lachnospiraceae bacterium]